MCFATVLRPTSDELRELIARSAVPVIVEMGAIWSPPSQLLRPFMRKLAIDLGVTAHVAAIDVDANRELRIGWEVNSVPQVLFFRHGKMVRRIDGYAGYAALRQAVTEFFGLFDTVSHDETVFAAAVARAESAFAAVETPADATFKTLWAQLTPSLDRFAAAERAAVARGECSDEDCRRRVRAEEARLMGPLNAQFAAAMAEAKALRTAFAAAIDRAVDAYAGALVSRIGEAQPQARCSA